MQLSRRVESAGRAGLKDMIVKRAKGVLALCLLVGVTAASWESVFLHAQEAEVAGSKRKVKTLGRPLYPELARKLNLSGVVKVEVTIGADGKVKRTHVIGGHPVLAPEAERAAMQSEFEPGPRETSEVIEFKFNPQ